MNSKTWWRLAILVGVFVLMCAGVYLIWSLQVGRMAQGVVAQAMLAEKEGNYARAVELYQEHLAVVPDDLDVQLKFAEANLKASTSPNRYSDALSTYWNVLARFPGREDVRRRAAEVAIEAGDNALEVARNHLGVLMKSNKTDGHLEYLLAQCDDKEGEYARAATHYRAAIELKAPEQLQASERLAILLRDKLGRAAEGDKVANEMVLSAPKDYRSYLGRGRYRGLANLPGAGDDFRKAQKLAPERVDVCLALAQATERESGLDAARQVLDAGLTTTPLAYELYLALSDLERRAGRNDRSIEALELGLKKMPDQVVLHVHLALILAHQGDTGKLLLQITELERIGASPVLIKYLTAYYHVNSREYAKARQVLAPLQPAVVKVPAMRAMVNMLLARCYAELNEPELQQEAALRGFASNPDDPMARLGWINVLIQRGDYEEAIKEYRKLLPTQPGTVRLPLAQLLIERNRRLPADQRQWAEVEKLIDAGAAAAPRSPDPLILRAQLLLEQGQEAKALDALDTIRRDFPKDSRPWLMEAAVRTRQGRFVEARAILNRARQRLGDRSDLRLSQARLAVAQGGPQVVPALEELARDVDNFSREERRSLLTELVDHMTRQQDGAGAVKVLARLVQDEPESVQHRLRLFEMASQSKDWDQAENQLKAITQLDRQFGQFCRAQLLIAQARETTDIAVRDKDRHDARQLLFELKVQRPDWARVPLALAALDEELMADPGLDEPKKKERLESAINSYRRALELGYRNPGVVRHVVQLLFLAGRGGEALEVYNQAPVGQIGGDLHKMIWQVALANRDYRQAEDIARKAVASRPDDFEARLWLVRVLQEDHRGPEAETVLREAVAAKKTDPDRWTNLVFFLVQNRELGKAEEAAREAETAVAEAPLALARCCQNVAMAYATGDAARSRTWLDRARHWFAEAESKVKDPEDFTVKLRLAEFFMQTNQFGDAEGALKDLMARTAASGKAPDVAAWARRNLARVYARSIPPRTAEALALFGNTGKDSAAVDPEDVRILAMVHESQATPEGRLQAIADIESLIARKMATTEDERAIAQLLDLVGDWPRAREQYRELILRSDSARDVETLRNRPRYLLLYVDALIRHHRPGDATDLAEVGPLIEKLAAIPGNALTVALLEAQVDKVSGRLQDANTRLKNFAARADLTANGRLRLAFAAEQNGLLDAAEAIFRKIAAEPPANLNQILLASYFGRTGQTKKAIDVLEGLWADASLRDRLAGMAADIVANPRYPLDVEQTNRVRLLIERARAENPRSASFLLYLGGVYDRLGQYPKAEECYRGVVHMNEDRDGVACNNLAWLLVLQGRGGSEALDLINAAVHRKGPIPEYLDTRGVIYLGDGQVQRAVTDLETALKGAASGSKYFHLAQAYWKLNEKEKARETLKLGIAQGLPVGLHPLEMAGYNRLTTELGMPAAGSAPPTATADRGAR